MDHLHNNLGLAHLDLKPDNIIIKDDYSTALIDFGHSHPIKRLVKNTCGTSAYLPPEVLRTHLSRGEYLYRTDTADIFTFGLIAFATAFEQMLF